jgi:hypothetical protein
MPETPGIFSGSFAIADGGETSPNVWYRVHLTVTDSDKFSFSTFRDVDPIVSEVTVTTNPPGFTILFDAQPHTAPFTVNSVVGMHRELSVPSVQYQSGSVWAFGSWSDGAAESHIIATPAADTMYTVNFVKTGSACTSVRILQNRGGGRYATLDAGDNLSWYGGTTQQADAEVFVREDTARGFTLKATSNDNYVVLSGDGTDATVAAAGATAVPS